VGVTWILSERAVGCRTSAAAWPAVPVRTSQSPTSVRRLLQSTCSDARRGASRHGHRCQRSPKVDPLATTGGPWPGLLKPGRRVSTPGVHRGRNRGRRGPGWAAGLMAESLGGRFRVSCSLETSARWLAMTAQALSTAVSWLRRRPARRPPVHLQFLSGGNCAVCRDSFRTSPVGDRPLDDGEHSGATPKSRLPAHPRVRPMSVPATRPYRAGR